MCVKVWKFTTLLRFTKSLSAAGYTVHLFTYLLDGKNKIRDCFTDKKVVIDTTTRELLDAYHISFGYVEPFVWVPSWELPPDLEVLQFTFPQEVLGGLLHLL